MDSGSECTVQRHARRYRAASVELQVCLARGHRSRGGERLEQRVVEVRAANTLAAASAAAAGVFFSTYAFTPLS